MKLKKIKDCGNVAMAFGINVKAIAVGEEIVVPEHIGLDLLQILECFEEVGKNVDREPFRDDTPAVDGDIEDEVNPEGQDRHKTKNSPKQQSRRG